MNDSEKRFYTEAITANRQIWDGLATLQKLQKESNGGDYGNVLPDGIDGGENTGYAHITSAQVLAVVHGTADALQAVLNTGHATNMVKVL